jgi:hypothetical protein
MPKSWMCFDVRLACSKIASSSSTPPKRRLASLIAATSRTPIWASMVERPNTATLPVISALSAV